MGFWKRLKKWGQKSEGDRFAAGQQRSPLQTDAQDTPEPERLTTPQENAGQAVHQLKEPPQAEGDRTRFSQ